MFIDQHECWIFVVHLKLAGHRAVPPTSEKKIIGDSQPPFGLFNRPGLLLESGFRLVSDPDDFQAMAGIFFL